MDCKEYKEFVEKMIKAKNECKEVHMNKIEYFPSKSCCVSLRTSRFHSSLSFGLHIGPS